MKSIRPRTFVIFALLLLVVVEGAYYVAAHPYGGADGSGIEQLFPPIGGDAADNVGDADSADAPDEPARKPVEADTFFESGVLNRIDIYDMAFLGKAFGYGSATLAWLHDDIGGNDGIPDRFKPLLHEYCDALVAEYPGIELRVLHENLKNLKIVEVDRPKLRELTGGDSSHGCYDNRVNTIYVPENYNYMKGSWPYQVIYHELSHALRTLKREWDGREVRVQVLGLHYSNEILEEALNSLFAVSLFDYDEDMVAYQLQSNLVDVMVECLDGYGLEDYVEHSLSWFARELDRQNGGIRAVEMLDMMKEEYEAYHSDEGITDPAKYLPLYEYVADMYFDKHLRPTMGESERRRLANELAERIVHNVPREYGIDVRWFRDMVDTYDWSGGE